MVIICEVFASLTNNAINPYPKRINGNEIILALDLKDFNIFFVVMFLLLSIQNLFIFN
jgi:hypothetical protein